MTNDLLINGNFFVHFLIYDFAPDFLVYEENFVFFFKSVARSHSLLVFLHTHSNTFILNMHLDPL
jgi:hypothetical protein